jgi:hypothetical protein
MARAGCGRQIDLPASNPWTAIIDANRHASTVTDGNERAKRQGAMRGRHCRAIQVLTIGGSMSAKTITSAVNACYFGMRNVACTKRQSCRNDPIRNGARINGKLSHTAA